MNSKKAFLILKNNKKNLTRQQLLTLKGLILKGEIEAFYKGIETLRKRKIIKGDSNVRRI